MDGEIDVAALQRAVEFLGEKPLAARLGQRAILNEIAARFDDDDLKLRRLRAMRLGQPLFHLFGLRQRQGAAAGADSQSRRKGACR